MTGHRTTTRALLALLACLLLLGTVAPAHAEDTTPRGGKKNAATVGIRTANAHGGDDRGVFDYEILPRGVVQDWVAISNYRYQPITVRLFAKDATSTPGVPFAVQASADTPHDVGAWIALKKNKVTIPPRTEIVVPFQLGVPHDATPGDHAGAIVVSLLAKEPKPEGGEIIVDHRVGMRVHLRVPGALKPALAVEKITTGWDGAGHVLGRGEATIGYLVRNTGNVALNVTGTVHLDRTLGPTVSASVPKTEALLPGGTALVGTTVGNVLGTGPAKVVIDVHGVPQDPSLKDKNVDVTKTVSFSAWPWLSLAVLAALVLLLIAGGWFERRRRSLAKARLAATEAEQAALAASAKHRMTVRTALVVAGLAAGLVGGLAGPAVAAKGDQWQAAISKKHGVAGEPFDIITSGGCPQPATNIVGFGYGAGFPKSGAVVISNNGPVSNEAGFTAAPVDNMVNLMALQPTPTQLRGTYKFVVRCIVPEFPDRSYGEYVAAITFTDPGHWRALAPLTTKKGPVVPFPTTGPNGEPLSPRSGQGASGNGAPSPGGTGQGGAAQGGAAQGDSATPGSAAAGQRAQELLEDQQRTSKGSGDSGLLLGLGIAVLVGSLLLAFGRRIPGPWRRTTGSA